MTLILLNAGIAPPIPEDFDFQPFLIISPALDPKYWPLRAQNEHNCTVETYNEVSMVATMRCRDDRVSFPDVGPLLKALFPYSSEELAMLAASMELCTKVGPLPTFLPMGLELVQLQKEKKGTKGAEMTKENAKAIPIAGSMVNLNPIERVAGQQPKPVVSKIFLYLIHHKLFLPVNWFTNKHLQLAQHRLHDLHTKILYTDSRASVRLKSLSIQCS